MSPTATKPKNTIIARRPPPSFSRREEKSGIYVGETTRRDLQVAPIKAGRGPSMHTLVFSADQSRKFMKTCDLQYLRSNAISVQGYRVTPVTIFQTGMNCRAASDGTICRHRRRARPATIVQLGTTPQLADGICEGPRPLCNRAEVLALLKMPDGALSPSTSLSCTHP